MISSILIAGTGASVIFNDQDDLTDMAENVYNDALDQITNYLKIEDIYGKYHNINGQRRIEKILVFTKQYITGNINVSDLIIKIQNNNDIINLRFSGYIEKINGKPMFENKIWGKTNNSYSIIVNTDADKSLIDYYFMNKDSCYLVIKLPEQFYMDKKDILKISLIPTPGIQSSVEIQTPSIHISNVIDFGNI